jgi:MoxR-like ATPase
VLLVKDRFLFNLKVDYPSFEEEVLIVKRTTSNHQYSPNETLSADDILKIQNLIPKIPIADNVVEYAVRLVGKTRPESDLSSVDIKKYLSWGAGPRASQYLVLAAKAHGALKGKYSPDIEDVKAVALPILRHRIVRNYKAEAEGVTIEKIVDTLL